MMIKIGILEDEPVFSNQLKSFLQQWAKNSSNLVDIKTYDTGQSFLLAWETKELFDIVFLDILLPQDNGMDVAKIIRCSDKQVSIIFVTSINEYAKDGYNVDAMKYLLKPLDYDDVQDSMDKLMDTLSHRASISYTYKTKSTVNRIPFRDILYFSSSLHHVEIHATKEIFRQYQRLQTIERHLPQEFIRCHRSFIVNIKYIYSIKPQIIELTTHEELPYSDSHIGGIKEAFLKYFG